MFGHYPIGAREAGNPASPWNCRSAEMAALGAVVADVIPLAEPVLHQGDLRALGRNDALTELPELLVVDAALALARLDCDVLLVREARDRLSEASYRVGLHYFRVRWYPGAIDRFREVLKEDPGFGGRDRIYFYLAESLARSDKTKVAEAIPYFERLLEEFPQSEHREDAAERLQALKAQ